MKKIINILKKIISGKFKVFKYYEYLDKPIKENDCLFESQNGKDINGNLFYLIKELNDKKYNKYTINVVVTKEYVGEFINKFNNYNITNYNLIIKGTNKYYEMLATCKYLFNDGSFFSYFVKREEQIYLNTWHGTPLKTLGRSIKDNFYTLGNVQKNFLDSNYLLYPSEYMMDVMLNDYMIEGISTNTKCLMSGYPRNEVFFDDRRRKEIRQKLNVDDYEILCYMPTWRGNTISLNSEYKSQIDEISSYLKEIDNNLSDKQIMYVNLHPFLKDKIDLSSYNKIKPFNKEYETYDFLNISDTLITDYSSVFFDYAITKRKILLFTYDYEEYFNDRGTYFDINTLPFKRCNTTKELIKEINNKNINDYTEFLNKYSKYENKDTSKNICEYIFLNKDKLLLKEIPNNKKKNILIYSGNLNKNGVTTALMGILNNVDLDKNNYYITYEESSVKNNTNIIKNFDKRINYISFKNNIIGTFKETLYFALYRYNIISYERSNKVLEKFYKREIKRCYGNSKFDTVIHFSGYGNYSIQMFSNFECNKVIYIHSNMLDEINVRHNQKYETLKNCYPKYNHVVCVAENLTDSIKQIQNKEDNIDVINNIIDYKNIISKSKKNIIFDEDTECSVTLEELNKILDSDKKKYISIGRFSKEKGFDRLLDAFEQINKDDYLIIIGGFGPLYEEILKRSNDHIIIIKSISNPFSVLKKCDCFIVSSLYEGFSLVMFEADTLKVPVISTTFPVSVELLNKYKGGHLVDNNTEGIVKGIEYFRKNKINLFDIDYEKYNKEIIEKFEHIL